MAMASPSASPGSRPRAAAATASSSAPGNQAGAIIVLSADGTLISRRATGAIDLVFVGKPKEPGKPGLAPRRDRRPPPARHLQARRRKSAMSPAYPAPHGRRLFHD
jgi:hypothetical protein